MPGDAVKKEVPVHFMCYNCQCATAVLIRLKPKDRESKCAWCGKWRYGGTVENVPPKVSWI